MLWIKADQPSLAVLLTAWVSGRPTVALHPDEEAGDRRAGREQYLDSQTTAVHVAMQAADIDPRRVSVHIRDRGFTGPSAGLVYALAVEDLLTPGDQTQGRTIAVTGGLLMDGSVEPIGWLTLKARGAADDHATLLVVPDDQASSGSGYVATTCGASTFRQAIADLARSGAHCISRQV
jgi:PDZ domain-containing secreted protein